MELIVGARRATDDGRSRPEAVGAKNASTFVVERAAMVITAVAEAVLVVPFIVIFFQRKLDSVAKQQTAAVAVGREGWITRSQLYIRKEALKHAFKVALRQG